MSTEWITEVLRDLIRFAQQNRMQRLARDLEQALQGLDDENERRNSALPESEGRSGAEEDNASEVSKQGAH